jgi:hypothetical protein
MLLRHVQPELVQRRQVAVVDRVVELRLVPRHDAELATQQPVEVVHALQTAHRRRTDAVEADRGDLD